MNADGTERLAKVMAAHGVASRREAEAMIAEGRVKVNGAVVKHPGHPVNEKKDVIRVDDAPMPDAPRLAYYVLYKPKGYIVSRADPTARQSVMELLPELPERVEPVGRLDINTEGLLLLTNDGALARRLELPTNAWLRRYRVRVFGAVDERQLAYLARGITIDGVAYGPIEAGLDSRQGGNAWLTVSLKEGKNREIRRVMAHLGLQVTRLIRVAYGPFQLGALPKAGVEEVHPRILREQLGIGEKPQRQRARDIAAAAAAAAAAAEAPPEPPKPTGPVRGRTIPRARNAEPRRPGRAANRRRPPSRP